jgi:hypothetical protein
MFQTGQYRTNYTSMFARWLLAFGLLVFVVTGTALMVFATGLLSYPAGWAPTLILIIEGAATVSIALSLASLYSSLAEPPYPSLDRSRGGV